MILQSAARGRFARQQLALMKAEQLKKRLKPVPAIKPAKSVEIIKTDANTVQSADLIKKDVNKVQVFIIYICLIHSFNLDINSAFAAH